MEPALPCAIVVSQEQKSSTDCPLRRGRVWEIKRCKVKILHSHHCLACSNEISILRDWYIFSSCPPTAPKSPNAFRCLSIFIGFPIFFTVLLCFNWGSKGLLEKELLKKSFYKSKNAVAKSCNHYEGSYSWFLFCYVFFLLSLCILCASLHTGTVL